MTKHSSIGKRLGSLRSTLHLSLRCPPRLCSVFVGPAGNSWTMGKSSQPGQGGSYDRDCTATILHTDLKELTYS